MLRYLLTLLRHDDDAAACHIICHVTLPLLLLLLRAFAVDVSLRLLFCHCCADTLCVICADVDTRYARVDV